MSVKVRPRQRLRPQQSLTFRAHFIALKFISPDVNPPIPWHRVISSSGAISSRGPGTDGVTRQRDTLIAEGVDVTTTRSGDFKVDLRTYGWFPAVGTIDIGQDVDGGEGEEDSDDSDREEGGEASES